MGHDFAPIADDVTLAEVARAVRRVEAKLDGLAKRIEHIESRNRWLAAVGTLVGSAVGAAAALVSGGDRKP